MILIETSEPSRFSQRISSVAITLGMDSFMWVRPNEWS